MDINSKINWQPGMELTAETFISLDRTFDLRQQVAMRLAAGGMRAGRIPYAEFCNKGVFVRNSFQMDRFRCTALLPSGKILDIDEPMSIKIPMLYGNLYYLTVGPGTGITEFEYEGVPFIRPEHTYAIQTAEELAEADRLPVVRFSVTDGVFNLDENYIPPCLSLESEPRFADYLTDYTVWMEKLATHANLEEGEGKRLFMRYLFLLKGYHLQNPLQDFILFTQEMAQAIDYYVMTPHNGHRDIPQPAWHDIQRWLEWLKNYFDGAVSILNTVVLEDHSINFDELKAQIKAEIYERLNPELYERLITDLKENLHRELNEELMKALTEYFDSTMKPELYERLSAELGQQLRDDLYKALYDALYNALYAPPEKEEEFIPLI